MRRYWSTINICESADHIWNIMTDVRHWHEWTPTISAIEPLDDAFALGSRFRIQQPKLKPSVWTITHMQPSAYFIWETNSPGVKVVAEHRIKPSTEGCVVTIQVAFSGLMGSIAGLLGGTLTKQYLEMECAGLKGRAES